MLIYYSSVLYKKRESILPFVDIIKIDGFCFNKLFLNFLKIDIKSL